MTDILMPPAWIIGVFVDAFAGSPPWAVALAVGAIGVCVLEMVGALIVFVAWSGAEHA